MSLTRAGDKRSLISVFLGLFDSDGAGFTDFHTGFTAEAFFIVGRVGLAVVHFIHFDGADIHTFATTNTLVGIDSHIPAHLLSSKNFWILTIRRVSLTAKIMPSPQP